jgi:hypothetical protein
MSFSLTLSALFTPPRMYKKIFIVRKKHTQSKALSLNTHIYVVSYDGNASIYSAIHYALMTFSLTCSLVVFAGLRERKITNLK